VLFSAMTISNKYAPCLKVEWMDRLSLSLSDFLNWAFRNVESMASVIELSIDNERPSVGGKRKAVSVNTPEAPPSQDVVEHKDSPFTCRECLVRIKTGHPVYCMDGMMFCSRLHRHEYRLSLLRVGKLQ